MSAPAADPASLTLTRAGAVATIQISNPARMNALTAAMWESLPRLVAEVEADPAIRVVILKGEGGKAFSAGADISEFATQRTGEAARTYDRLNHEAFKALSAAKKPLIAEIHGFCLGGGLAIAACCDLRYCDETAQFAIPAAKLGIGYNPRWITPLLALAAPADVKELLFTGRRFPAEAGLRMGLVNRVVEGARLSSEVAAVAAEIAANAPLTIRAAKQAIDTLWREGAGADTTLLDASVEACFASADYREGQSAFLDKRRPRFQGH